jgi:diaminohydroxyphosphoribosylaminopyrimidine deaminase / 5-amino-6-(5-phosphoribosylamino)uracil reductase
LLTARPAGPRLACRVVLDSHARLPTTSQLARTARQVSTLIVANPTSETAPLAGLGCEILPLPTDADGHPDVSALLDELGRRRWTNLLVEGGSAVLGSFFDQGAVDEVHVFVAPKLIGGVDAKSPAIGRGVDSIAQSGRWKTDHIENVDGDIYLRWISHQSE